MKLQNPTAQELQSQERKLRARLATAQSELFRTYTAKNKNPERIAATRSEILELESRYNVLLKRIKSQAPELMEIVVSEPVSLKSLQQNLPNDTEIIEYLALDSQLLVWHIGKRQVTVKSVFLPRTEIPGKVTELYNSLKIPKETFDRELARELFLYLIRPIRDFIRADHLVIIPHEELSYIPFQVLFDQETNQYFGESYQISYAPSASIFSKMELSRLSGRLLAVADPSSNILVDEAKAIARAYSANDGAIFTQSLMSEAHFKSIAGQYNVIHLSVHGKYNFNDPLLSHLTLSPGQNEDGELTAAEIFGLPLQNVNLITLSACESGRFEATHANEILGISRALIYAGAKASILSFWKVDAGSTALWMETFYRRAKTNSLTKAAQRALIKVKSQREFNHPYYWAAFFLLGK